MTINVNLDLTGRVAAAWMLGSFVVVFVVTRVVVRMIRAGKGPFRNQSVGGVHLHHLVWGIFAMLVAGVGEFTYQPHPPWVYVLAALFGAGAALTLDEFALWLHLSDVYWEREGRVSVDAVLVVGALMALLVVGANPFDSTTNDGVTAFVATIVVNGVLAVVALFKGRPLLGLLGILVPVLALVGAVRLARPTSPWARWRYHEGSSKAIRSRRRFPERDRRRWDAVVEAIAGRPEATPEPDAAPAGTTQQDPAPQDPAPQDPAPQDPAPQDTAPQDTAQPREQEGAR